MVRQAHTSSDDCKAELVGSQRTKIVPFISTEFVRIINAFGLGHLKIKLANPLSHDESENTFIDEDRSVRVQYHQT